MTAAKFWKKFNDLHSNNQYFSPLMYNSIMIINFSTTHCSNVCSQYFIILKTNEDTRLFFRGIFKAGRLKIQDGGRSMVIANWTICHTLNDMTLTIDIDATSFTVLTIYRAMWAFPVVCIINYLEQK